MILSDGSTVDYDAVISTIPLPRLVRLLGPEAPPAVKATPPRDCATSVRCVNLGVGRSNLTDKHWIYYPEDGLPPGLRPGQCEPVREPARGFGLTCEITYSKDHPLPLDGDALIERCVADCQRVGLIGDDGPIWTACQADLPYAYVVYDHERRERVEHIRAPAARAGRLSGGTLQRVGVLQLGSRLRGGTERGAFGAEPSRGRRALAWRTGRPAPRAERASMTI